MRYLRESSFAALHTSHYGVSQLRVSTDVRGQRLPGDTRQQPPRPRLHRSGQKLPPSLPPHTAGEHTTLLPYMTDIFYPLLLWMSRWILHQFSRGKWGYFVLKECSYGSAPGDVWCNYPGQTGGAGRQLQGGRVQRGGRRAHCPLQTKVYTKVRNHGKAPC